MTENGVDLRSVEYETRDVDDCESFKIMSMFLKVTVGKLPSKYDFLIDTGSSVSVVNTTIFDSLYKKQLVSIEETNGSFQTVSGEEVSIKGLASIIIKVGKHRFPFRFIIADITQSGILGVDFLKKYNSVVDINRQQVRLGKWWYNCHTEKTVSQCCHLILQQSVTLPPDKEYVVPVQIRLKGNVFPYGLAESSSELVNLDKGVLVGRTLINPCQGNVTSLSMLNLSGTVQTLPMGARVATLSPVKVHNNGLSDNKIENMDPYLNELFVTSTENLDSDQTEVVKHLLLEHSETFMKVDKKLGKTDLLPFQIDTGDSPPIRLRAYRLPVHKREEVDRQVAEMLEQGVIRPSTSPYSAPIVLVSKKDGTMRFCTDFRALNAVTKKNAFPLPRIDDTLDALSGAKYFSNLDWAAGYWQCEMAEKDREKTAFTTGTALYEYNVLPFGVVGATAHFERLMELVLAGLHWKTCLIFLDDILVYSDSFTSHVERLREVLCCLAKAGLKLKPQKCKLFQRKVKYLGHVVSDQGISTDPEKLAKVSEWPTPRCLKDVRSFIGLCSYYRKFVRNFSNVAKSLFDLMKKDAKFVWDDNCQEAFETLKYELTHSVVLAYPDFSKPFILDTDASDVGIGAVLSQNIDGVEKVVAYYSTTHTPQEKNYSVTRKELLAIVKAVKHFKHYLYGCQFTLRTDHGSLRWLYNFKQPEGQVARWIEFLEGFRFKIVHRPGRLHNNADALSRYPVQCNAIQCYRWTKSDISLAQKKDPNLAYLIDLKRMYTDKPIYDVVASQNVQIKSYWFQWEQLEFKDEILYRRWVDDKLSVSKMLIVVPDVLQTQVLYGAHNSPTGGHLGINKTIHKIRQLYYWVGMHKSVTKWLRHCPECQARKNPLPIFRAPLKPMRVGEPLERVGIDIMGPLPVTPSGNKYIMVIMDYFTKWVESYALPNQEARTVARALVDNFITRFGVPKSIHTDQGSNFESELFQELCYMLGTFKTRTTPYHPMCDGLVERYNRSIQNVLSAYINKEQNNWDTYLQIANMAYRCSIQETTKFTPNMLFLGREINIPLNLMAEPVPGEIPSCSDYVETLQKKFNDIYTLTRENIHTEQLRQKVRYDVKQHGIEFEVGQKVWLYMPQVKVGTSKKLHKFWDGPFIVVKKLSTYNYTISREGGRYKQVVHFNRLKPYFEPLVTSESEANMPRSNSDVTENVQSDIQFQLTDEELGFPPRDVSQGEILSPLPTTSRGRIRTRPGWMLTNQYEF